jgi:hypothetical protein
MIHSGQKVGLWLIYIPISNKLMGLGATKKHDWGLAAPPCDLALSQNQIPKLMYFTYFTIFYGINL